MSATERLMNLYIKHIMSKAHALLFVLTALFSVSVFSQEKAAIYAGPFDITPTLGVNIQHDDNVFSAPSGSEQASVLTVIAPSLSAVADDGVKKYTITYQLENVLYSQVDNSDYVDHNVAAQLDWRIDIRHLIVLDAGLATSQEAGISVSELNESENTDLGLQYVFGSDGSNGRVTVAYDSQSLRYNTNAIDTHVLESDSQTLSADVSLGFTPTTKFIFQVIEGQTRFLSNTLSDRDDRSYLIGAAWDVTDLISGDVRIGRSKNALVNGTDDTSLSTGNASINWAQQDYSVFTFGFDKSVSSSATNVGVFVDTTAVSVDWTYSWSDRLTMDWTLEQQKQNFIGVNRQDDTDSLGVSFVYAMRRWLNLGVGVTLEDRKSTDPSVDYTRNGILFTVNASL